MISKAVHSSLRAVLQWVRGKIGPLTDPAHEQLVDASGFFDSDWYLEHNPDVATQGLDPLQHYLMYGWRERRSPGPNFDVAFYLNEYPDVACSGIEPVRHYWLHGAEEGRYVAPSVAAQPIAPARSPFEGVPMPTMKELAQNDSYKLIASKIAGLDVLDIGAMRPAMARSLFLLSSGARSARILVHELTPSADQHYRAMAAALGLSPAVQQRVAGFDAIDSTQRPQDYWTSADRRNSWAVLGRRYERDLINKVGPVDAVIVPDILLHELEPMRVLRRAAQLSNRYVFLDIPLTRPFTNTIRGEKVTFASDDMMFAGHLDPLMISALDASWSELGINLQQFKALPNGITPALASQRQLDGVWWWFYGRHGIKRLLGLCGLQIEDMTETWGGRFLCICARKVIDRQK